ncbi:MAG TPA: substrate-binding domain-containing protein [Solirubrobacterales bacterium]|nr:substrate-binding domain-containing protein [Solirubrobacterales bacterium]
MLFRVRTAVVALGVCAAIGVAGCGSGSQTGSTGSGEESTTGTAQALVPKPPTTPPTTLSITKPLSKKPEEGKTVAMVTSMLPATQYYTEQTVLAAKVLGWTVDEFPYKEGEEAKALSSALNTNPDYLIGTNLLKQAVKAQLSQAREKGIPFLNLGGLPEDNAPSEGYYVINGDPTGQAQQLADWAINDSGGKANIAFFTIPALPYVAQAGEAVAARISEKCPGCQFEEVELSLQQLVSGKSPTTIAASLQSHPDVTYAIVGYGDMAVGLPGALKAAGLSGKFKVMGVGANQANIAEIAKGELDAFAMVANASVGYYLIDTLARISVGDSTAVDTENTGVGGAETWILDSPELAKEYAEAPYGWEGPENYIEQWKALWHVN